MSDSDDSDWGLSGSDSDEDLVDLLWEGPAQRTNHPAFTRQDTFRVWDKLPNDLEEEFVESETDDLDEFIKPRNRWDLYDDSDSNSEDEDKSSEIGWTSTEPHVSFPFSGTPREVSIPQPTPMKFFKLLFNEDFITFLTTTINKQGADLAMQKNRQFLPTDNEEVYTLLCLHFLMRCYGGVATMSFGAFGRFMRMPRFKLLCSLLTHTVNPDEDGDYEDAAARRVWYDVANPVVGKFNELMKQLMTPGKQLKLDVTEIIPKHDKVYFKQRDDPAHMHFLFDKDNVVQRIYLEDPDIEQSGKEIALTLMADFLNAGHSLHSCPHYTSISLAENLLKSKTNITGIAKRFKNPLFKKNNPAKELIAYVHKEPDHKGRISKSKVVSGYNSKGVCVTVCYRADDIATFLSTEFGAKPAKEKRIYDCQVAEEIMKSFDPEPWSTMTKYFISPFSHRVNKQVGYTLQAMLVNAWLLYNQSSANPMKLRAFVEDIIYQMLPVEVEQARLGGNA